MANDDDVKEEIENEEKNSYEEDTSNENPVTNVAKNLVSAKTFKLKLIIIIFAVVFFLILFLVIDEDDNQIAENSGNNCVYNLPGVSKTGTVSLENIKVELVNCDAKPDNYKVLETIDFEKYVLGVALAEVGENVNDELTKAGIIMARGFALTRNSGMCSDPDNCFYGYNKDTNVIRMRACTNDQVYFDYTKDMYDQARTDGPTLYSPEVNSGNIHKAKLSEERKKEVETLASEVRGQVLVDKSGKPVKTAYVKSVQDRASDLANSGDKYDTILKKIYSDAVGFATGDCTSYNSNIDYGNYVLSSTGHTILNIPIDNFLKSKGSSLDNLNSLIASNVQKNGYGTRSGVVTAAVTLIAEMGNNYHTKLPYFWGGGHGAVSTGANSEWGAQAKITASGSSKQPVGTIWPNGLDCSGFIRWAVYNGGFKDMGGVGTSRMELLWGVKRVNLTSKAVLQPGDLLLKTGSHVILVVGIDEKSNQYICAEASGASSGILFSRKPFNLSGFHGIDMTEYYNKNVRN